MATRSNLGPLTTTWEPRADCSLIIADCDSCTLAQQAQFCGSNAVVTDNADCWPPRSSSAPASTVPFNGWGFYSPGIACPTGWAPACSQVQGNDAAGNFEFQFPLVASETAVGCCPSGYQCVLDANSHQTCRFVAQNTVVNTGTCRTDGSNIEFGPKTIPFLATVTSADAVATITANRYTVEAPLYQLVFRASDSASFPTQTGAVSSSADSSSSSSEDSATPTSTRMSTASSTVTDVDSPTDPPSEVSSNPPSSQSTAPGDIAGAATESTGLSSGAKAGIAVGTIAAVAIIAILAFLYFRMRRRMQASMSNPRGPGSELDGTAIGYGGSDSGGGRTRSGTMSTWTNTVSPITAAGPTGTPETPSSVGGGGPFAMIRAWASGVGGQKKKPGELAGNGEHDYAELSADKHGHYPMGAWTVNPNRVAELESPVAQGSSNGVGTWTGTMNPVSSPSAQSQQGFNTF